MPSQATNSHQKAQFLHHSKQSATNAHAKRENKKIDKIYRVYEKTPEPEKCLMEQGILCMGMATRSGCGAQCLTVDMPCTGCGGPAPNVPEQGAAMITALASILGYDGVEGKTKYTEKEIEELMAKSKTQLAHSTCTVYQLLS